MSDDIITRIEMWRTIRLIAVLAFAVIIIVIGMQISRSNQIYYGMPMNWGWSIVGSIFGVLILIWFFSWLFWWPWYPYNHRAVRDLQRRYARGEISEREYKKILREIIGKSK